MIDLQRDGACWVATLGPPNTVTPDWQARMLEVLDTVEGDCEGEAGLVLTGTGKFFCNGLDVEVVMSLQGDDAKRFGQRMMEIMGRLVQLPVPTVAAINGHAFAAGAFLALACDYRLMREDRGWFCVSEVDVGVPIGAPMMGLLKAKLPPATARDAVLTGRRYDAAAAIEAGIADGKATESELLGAAKTLLANLASKERRIFTTLKRSLYVDAAEGFEAARR